MVCGLDKPDTAVINTHKNTKKGASELAGLSSTSSGTTKEESQTRTLVNTNNKHER